MLPDIKYYKEFGGEKIIFEKEETAKIKRIVDQGTSYSYSVVYIHCYDSSLGQSTLSKLLL